MCSPTWAHFTRPSRRELRQIGVKAVALSRRALLRAFGTVAVTTAVATTGAASMSAATGGVDWEALRKAMKGTLSLPGEPNFEAVRRGFNPLADNQVPAAVAQCRSPEDVGAAVRTAATKMPVAARSGGHSYAGYSVPDRGLVVDVGQMSTVDVRPDGTAVIGAGARLGDVYRELAHTGHCLPAGSCSTVGIAGLTLGGGIGVLTRKFGLTCDHLLAAEIVTADGEVRTVSADDEPDLFWALRGGGGGNFGIVTSLTFATDPAPALSVFGLTFPPGSAAAVLGAWQRWISHAAPELWSNLHISGGTQPGCKVSGCFVGPSSELVPLLDDLARRCGVLPQRTVQDKTYLDAMRHFSGKTDRESFVASSRVLNEPAAEPAEVAELLRHRQGVTLIFDALGGAVSTMDPAATAFPHRQAIATAQVYSQATPQNRASVTASVREVTDGLGALGIGGGYVNYIDPALPDWANAYYGPNLGRLRQVAETYDPNRVFAAQGPLSCAGNPACHLRLVTTGWFRVDRPEKSRQARAGLREKVLAPPTLGSATAFRTATVEETSRVRGEPGDRAYDDDCGRLHVGFAHRVGHLGQRRAQRALAAHGALLHHGDRGLRVAAVFEQHGRELPDPLDRHHEHQGPAEPSQRRPVHKGLFVVRSDVPGRDDYLVRDASVRHRHVSHRGRGEGAGDARHGRHSDARLDAGQQFLESAPEHVRIAALEPNHELSGLGVLDEQRVDHVLVRGATVGDLGRVDDLDMRCEFLEQLARGEAVGDHHVGAPQQPAPADGDQIRVPRTTPDQRDTGRRAFGTVVDDPRPQRFRQRVPHRRRAPVITAGEHTEQQLTVLRHGRGHGRALGSVVSADAEHPAGLGLRRDSRVDLVARRTRHGVPRTVQVAVGVPPAVPGQLTRLCHGFHRRRRLRRDHLDAGPRVDQPGDAALGDRAGTDDHHPLAGEV
jgi:FAD/FMN-containing dehydrogenase